MYSYKYKGGYLIYNRDSNKIFSTHKLPNDIEEQYGEEYNNIQYVSENKGNINFKEVQITYISTPFCNLNCKYCYEHNKQSSVGITTMSAEQHYEVYKSIQDYYTDANIKICFFGGEPFLANQSIFKFIEMLKYHCKKDEIIFPSLAAITNGTLLDASTRKFVYDYFDGITFSLDGTKILHDANRLYRDGRGSFDDVIYNIHEFNKLNSSRKVSTTCEVTLTDAYFKNYSYKLMSEVWMLLKELKFNIVEFITVIDNNVELIDKEENLDLIAKDLINLWYDDILNNSSPIKVPSFINYLSLFIGKKTNENVICGAGRNYFAVDSNYNVYPCQVSVFQDNNVIGRIRDNKLNFNNTNNITYSKKSEHPLCKECECLKGCSTFCKIIMSSTSNGIPTSCSFNKKLFKYSLLKIVEIMNSNKKDQFVEGVKNLFKNGGISYERLI